MISISLFSTASSTGSIFDLSFQKKLDDIKNRKWVSCPNFIPILLGKDFLHHGEAHKLFAKQKGEDFPVVNHEFKL